VQTQRKWARQPVWLYHFATEPDAVAEPAGTREETACDFAGHCILVAEDVDINREIVQSLLEDRGLAMDFA